MRDERGRPLRVAGLIADETERHQIEEILEESLNRVNHLLEGTIDVISRLVESRDPYTAGHQKRVSQLAGAVARRMGLPRESVKGIQVAGLLHDIGKVCVPSDILSKPGKLTSLEFDLIRDHPSRGALILGKVDFPWPVRDIVQQHHERLDGLGYPLGLAGDEIRQESRIMAVADVVEAMISHRPYRPALGLEAALEEIRQGRGILYDPAAVEACEAVFVEGFCFEA
jgi:putative nucleotidyltransferase with HDIG domain